MKAKKQLKGIERGKTFEYTEYEWIVLEHFRDTSLVLMEDILDRRSPRYDFEV